MSYVPTLPSHVFGPTSPSLHDNNHNHTTTTSMPSMLALQPSSPRSGSMVTDPFYSARNPGSDPNARSLKNNTAVNQGNYVASPSQLAQLSMPTDMHSATGLPHQYSPTYGYVPAQHEPPFSFAHSHRQPQMPPSLTGQQPQYVSNIPQLPPPDNPRKRRGSEIDSVMPGSANSSASAYTHSTGLMGAHSDLDLGVGAPAPPPSLPSPVVKKGRTNTPWTPAEEHRLKQLRDTGSSWSEIAKAFPARTEGSVKKHWYKDMHYADFAEDESTTLLQAIKEYENNKWKVIGQKVGKPAKACEQYAKDQGWKV